MTIKKSSWSGPAFGVPVLISLLLATAWADSPTTRSTGERVQELMRKDLTDVPGKNLQMLTVEYPPGGASPPHRHHAQVFVYVLSGAMRMQVQGSPEVTLQPGQTFYEGVDDVHSVSANASQTEPARILVFMVKDKDADEPRKTESGNRP